jgi:outer membrane protein
MKIPNIAATVAVIAAAAGNQAVCAAESSSVSPNELRVGAYFLNYDVKASDLAGPFVPAGVNLDVKDVTTPYFAYARRLSPHFLIELAAGVPPKTETIGKGPATLGSVPFNGQVLSTAKWFAPTLLAIYVFGPEDAQFRPYLGAGVNHTKFYDLKSTPAGDAASGGPTAITLSSSTGLAVTAGLRWRIKDRWAAYASYDYSRVNSDYSGNTAGFVRTTHIKFNPYTLVVSLGYSF